MLERYGNPVWRRLGCLAPAAITVRSPEGHFRSSAGHQWSAQEWNITRDYTPAPLSQLIEPHDREIPPTLWEAAGALAGLRRASNEKHRRSDRDRGKTKNRLNDLMGSVFELVGLVVCGELPSMTVSHHLLDLQGSVDDVDLVLTRGEQTRGIEVKGHFMDRPKQYFAVNERAHTRSISRGAAGYLPIVAAAGSPICRVGQIVSTHALTGWDRRDFGYGDNALTMGLDLFTRTWMSTTVERLQLNVNPSDRIVELSMKAEEIAFASLERARRDGFGLDGLTVEEAVVALRRIGGAL